MSWIRNTHAGAMLLAAAALAPSCAAAGTADDPFAPEDATVVEACETPSVTSDPMADVYGYPPAEGDVAGHADEMLNWEILAEALDASTGGATRPVGVTSDSAELSTGRSRSNEAILLENGNVLRGKILSDDGEAIELEFQTRGGVTGVTKIPYDRLHPRTVVRRMLLRTGDDDASGHLAIADYASENGLFDLARVHYLHAGSIDNDLAEEADAGLMKLIERASGAELIRGETALKKGRTREARRVFGRILREFPGTAASVAAQQHIDGLSGAATSDAWMTSTELSEKDVKRLEPIDSLYRSAEAHSKSGLEQSESGSRAIREFKAAVTAGERARRKLASLRKGARNNPALAAAVDELDASAKALLIENHIHLASVYLTRSDTRNALGSVNRALALDPDNREALGLRARIENAANRDRDYRYRDDWPRGIYRFGWRRFGHVGWRRISLGGTRSAFRGGAFRGGGRR